MGQQVTVWISKGSQTKTVKCPDVRGMDIAKAIDVLRSRNLEYDYERIESDQPKNEVVEQSVKPKQEVPEKTVVFLSISKGPAETEKPTEAPTEPPTEKPTQPPTTPTEPTIVTKKETISLPTDKTESYTLSIRLGGVKVLDDIEIDPATWGSTLDVRLEGEQGKTYAYEIYIDNVLYTTIEVTF